MNPEVFAEWFRKQGQQVVRTSSSYWVNQGSRAFQAFPYHWVIQPTRTEIDVLMKVYGAAALRYSTPLEAPVGYVSYHTVLQNMGFEFPDLGKRTRKNVRRGLSSCQVEPVSFERLADEGFLLQLDTLHRQGRKLDLAHSRWKLLCLTAGELPGFEAWGALVEGKLAAAAITVRMEDSYYVLYQHSLRQYLPENINNALTFTFTQELAKRPETRSIFYGLHSLDAPPSLDEFKFRMGYSPRVVRQRVVFHPWLRPFANGLSQTIARWLLNHYPGNSRIAKAEGMLRFYREGSRPAELQTWPECLVPQKQEVLNAMAARGRDSLDSELQAGQALM